jgi:hypothetical protein
MKIDHLSIAVTGGSRVIGMSATSVSRSSLKSRPGAPGHILHLYDEASMKLKG